MMQAQDALKHFDERRINVIGGGLAGLSLALGLRQRGVDVTVREAGRYPRHRVCGEFIAGVEAATLSALGCKAAFEGALTLQTIAWYRKGSRIRRDRLPRPALGISREVLDQRLADQLTEQGGSLVTAQRESEFDAPGRVHCHGRRPATDSPWTGLKAHVINYPLETDLELHIGLEGYCGVSRLPEGRANVCGLFHRSTLGRQRGSSLLTETIARAGLSVLSTRLQSADFVDGSLCSVSALGYTKPPRTGSACLGDRYGLIPPFTGNGMSLAFESAAAALEPLTAYARHQAGWDATKAALRRVLRARFAWRLAVARSLHRLLLHPLGQTALASFAGSPQFPFATLYRWTH